MITVRNPHFQPRKLMKMYRNVCIRGSVSFPSGTPTEVSDIAVLRHWTVSCGLQIDLYLKRMIGESRF